MAGALFGIGGGPAVCLRGTTGGKFPLFRGGRGGKLGGDLAPEG